MKKVNYFLLILIFHSPILLAQGSGKQAVFTIIDYATDNPLAKAKIEVDGFTKIEESDINGRATFSGIKTSRITFRVTRENYRPYWDSRELDPQGRIPPIRLHKLPPKSFIINGKVKDCEGKGIEGVSINYNLGKQRRILKSKEFGWYEIEFQIDSVGQVISPGEIEIRYKDDCQDTQEINLLPTGTIKTVDFKKTCKCEEKKMNLSGIVIDGNTSSPIVKAKVEITIKGSPDKSETIFSDSMGRFLKSDLISGTVLKIRVTHDSYWGEVFDKKIETFKSENVIKTPIDKKKLIDFKHHGISNSVAIGGFATLGYGIFSFTKAKSIHDEYERYVYETDFINANPQFKTRDEAYRKAEKLRKMSAWLLPVGAICVGSVPLIRKVERNRIENGLNKKYIAEQSILKVNFGFTDVSLSFNLN